MLKVNETLQKVQNANSTYLIRGFVKIVQLLEARCRKCVQQGYVEGSLHEGRTRVAYNLEYEYLEFKKFNLEKFNLEKWGTKS